MRNRTVVMFAAAGIAAVLWALHFIPSIPILPDTSDFFGGVAIGIGFGATVVWLGERTPRE